METYALNDALTVQDIVRAAQSTDGPVTVQADGEECLVAMRPAVFEEMLFDTIVLGAVDRRSLRL